MTEREAINGLKNLFSEHELTLPNTDSLEVLHMAIEALEKQIPKKAINPQEDYGTFICPNCGGLIYALDEFKTHKHCLLCSQKLDWSE